LEWHVCRRTRAADIPGHAIPAAYAQYVRTGFERDMDIVLYHNALDLVTLFDLAHRLAADGLQKRVLHPKSRLFRPPTNRILAVCAHRQNGLYPFTPVGYVELSFFASGHRLANFCW
jgi:hypothetical protein